MSQLEVDKIVPQSGTTLTIGDSGDTVNFADGTSIGIDTNTLYIDSTNNRVGIGTSSPSQLLEVSATSGLASGSGTTNAIRIADVGAGSSWSTTQDFSQLQFSSTDTSTPGGSGVRYSIGVVSQDAANTYSNLTFRNYDGTEHMRINGALGYVGIGTNSPSANLHIESSSGETGTLIKTTASDAGVNLVLNGNKTSNTAGIGSIQFQNNGDSVGMIRSFRESANDAGGLSFWTQATGGSNSERMRIDSSGRLLVNTTSYLQDSDEKLSVNGIGTFQRAGNTAIFNRTGSDGDAIRIEKDGSISGSIGHTGSGGACYIAGSNNVGLQFNNVSDEIRPCNSDGSARDNAITLGNATRRFKDLYLGGGLYVGGTGTANKLDDYEEGSWTPTLDGTGSSPTLSYSQQAGRYTKIGRTVTIDFYVQLNSSGNSGGTGSLTINGFPFNVGNLPFHGKSGSCMYTANFSTAGNGAPIGMYVNSNTTYAFLRSPQSSYPSSSGVVSTQASDVGNSLIVSGTLTYQIT